MKKRTKVQKIIMTCKSFCYEKSKGSIVTYIIKLFVHFCVCYGHGQMAGSNWLNFSEEILGDIS